MIRRIRSRFIRIALLVLALAMALVAGIINAANWVNVRSELSQTMENLGDGGMQAGKRGAGSRHMRNMLDESRFFSVNVLPDGSWALNDTSRMTGADSEELARVASAALASGRTSGFAGDYLFSIAERRGGSTALFLNCETKLEGVRRLALISVAACVGCVLLAWLLVALFSSRAIRPLAENAIQQKQFITDAGHELKTPLTVISANMDVLAMETGQNEWIQSTRKQVAGMRALVNELIYLSRLDEEDSRLQPSPIDFSRLVREAAEPFAGMAEFSGKALRLDVEDGLRLTGDEGTLMRLVSILCDNAVKYAPDGDEIALRARRSGRGILLSTENGLAKPLDDEALRRLFDRFYRADASRSKDSGGFGIGLSIARAVALKHGGDLRAQRHGNGRIAFVCTLRRLEKQS